MSLLEDVISAQWITNSILDTLGQQPFANFAQSCSDMLSLGQNPKGHNNIVAPDRNRSNQSLIWVVVWMVASSYLLLFAFHNGGHSCMMRSHTFVWVQTIVCWPCRSVCPRLLRQVKLMHCSQMDRLLPRWLACLGAFYDLWFQQHWSNKRSRQKKQRKRSQYL